MSTRIGIEGLKGIPTLAGVNGVLLGVLDAELEVWDPIAGAEIVAVPDREQTLSAARGASRRGVAQVRQEQVEAAAASPGALRGETDGEGRFALAAREGEGGFWRIYASFSSLRPPFSEKPAALKERVSFDLGVHAAREGIAAVLPEALYCTLRRMADWWTIFGRVAVCDTGQAIAGARVSAFDTDWLQDDALGTGISSASGTYRIDYPGSRFRRGTFLDVELFGGPDVYFTVIDADGNDIIPPEPPEAGRAPGRADRDCCARVDLCARIGQPAGTRANAWLKVGDAFVIPDLDSNNDFDAQGYMGPAAKWVLGSHAMLVGDVELEVGGRPVEYRFRVSDSPTDNGAAPPAESTFTRVVGHAGGAELFVDGAVIGEMVRVSPWRVVKINALRSDLRDGWLRVNDCIARVFSSTPGLSVADISSFIWNPDALMVLNTHALTSAPNVPSGSAAPGSAVPAASHIPLERVALRFDIRTVDPDDPTSTTDLPGNGITLNSLMVNNNAVYLALGVKSDGMDVLCEPAHGEITLPYTAYHPHLAGVSLDVQRNGGAHVFAASPLAGNTSPAVDESRSSGVLVSPTLTRCAYIVTLSASSRRHDGHEPTGGTEVQAAFFYE